MVERTIQVVASDHLVTGVAGEPLSAPVPVQDSGLAIDEADSVVEFIEQASIEVET
jgi:hypothetical protein